MSLSTTPTVTRPLDAARALAPRIRAAGDEIEEARRLPDWLVRALRDAGLFRMYVPRALGGLEVDPLTMIRVVEELACADGSTGWCVMVANQVAYFSGRVHDETAMEIFGRDPDVIVAGTGAPVGRAVAVEGGYRVSGRWPYASGITHATWASGNCRVYDGDTPRVDEAANPVFRAVWFPVSEVAVLDTWRTTGLRGTGSHDFTVTDVFVPTRRSFNVFGAPEREPDPMFRVLALCWSLQGGQALGIARHAIEALIELGGAKTTRDGAPLREQASVQEQVARAQALVASARLYLEDATRALWEALVVEAEPTMAQRAQVMLAAGHAARSAREAVELMYFAADSSAIHSACPLERCWRDITTAATHLAVRTPASRVAGRLALGMDLNATMAAFL